MTRSLFSVPKLKNNQHSTYFLRRCAVMALPFFKFYDGCNMIKKEKKRRRWWRTELYRKRVGNELMQDLKFQHVSGHYKNFTRMSPTDFDKLLTMIGPKISKKDTTCTFAGE
jgi:transposase